MDNPKILFTVRAIVKNRYRKKRNIALLEKHMLPHPNGWLSFGGITWHCKQTRLKLPAMDASMFFSTC